MFNQTAENTILANHQCVAGLKTAPNCTDQQQILFMFVVFMWEDWRQRRCDKKAIGWLRLEGKSFDGFEICRKERIGYSFYMATGGSEGLRDQTRKPSASSNYPEQSWGALFNSSSASDTHHMLQSKNDHIFQEPKLLMTWEEGIPETIRDNDNNNSCSLEV